MTTYVQRAPTVTAHIATGGPAPVATPPTGGTYTVTAYVNVSPYTFLGFGHQVAEVTAEDGTPLLLTFHAGGVSDSHAAAEAAFDVGNRRYCDDLGQHWPTNTRMLSVGDVLKVTGPDGATVHLRTGSTGFAEIEPPTHQVPNTP